MAVASLKTVSRREARARGLIVAGAVSAALGVGLSGSFAPLAGGVALLAGWLALIVGVHGYGRAGSDAEPGAP